jgi:hypothetical protein
MVVSLSPLMTIMPIVAFLFVFILIYALLMKTQVLGDNKFVALFLSLIVAVFFIVNTQMVDFVKINVSWFVVFVVCLFMILTFVGLAGKDALKTVSEHKAVAWILMGILIIVFVIASSYVFNWVLNWDMIKSWFDQPWFGTLLLAIFAFIVARVLIGAKK